MPGQALEIGARVELRTPTARDADEFLRLVRESRQLHHPWVKPPDTHDAFARYLRRLRGDRHAGFFVCARNDGESIAGVININEIIRGNFQSATLGYYRLAGPVAASLRADTPGSESRASTTMTEGMKLVIRHAFETMNLHRLEANVQPGNERSIALVKRCGFEYEGFSPRFLKVGGEWRDHERWAIVAETSKGRKVETSK